MEAVRRAWRPTMRIRLTALYGALFLATGGTMVAIVYVLQSHAVNTKPWVVVLDKSALRSLGHVGLSGQLQGPVSSGQLPAAVAASHSSSLLHLLVITVSAIATLGVVGILVGWWLAGRVLRPLHRITATARRLSSRNLDERIALSGPDDELKELADTFDGMLARLERAFDDQRRFIANVSHELRTPLAVQRTIIELGLSSPATGDVARAKAELLEANRRTERLINGLLSLARSDCGLEHADLVRLDLLVTEVVDSFRQGAAAADVQIELDTRPATVVGDRVLLTHLMTNLVQNAVRYNQPGGYVRVEASADAGLRVSNTGPLIPEEKVDELFEPFVRLAPPRTGVEGAGLGLSIVRAICRAHGTSATASARPSGGLDVRIPLPMPC
jgi:signal transduction histidine kinase